MLTFTTSKNNFTPQTINLPFQGINLNPQIGFISLGCTLHPQRLNSFPHGVNVPLSDNRFTPAESKFNPPANKFNSSDSNFTPQRVISSPRTRKLFSEEVKLLFRIQTKSINLKL